MPDMRGFTLIEAIIAMVVLSAAAVGVLMMYAGPMAASADPMIRAQARAVASSYMDEILLRDYGSGPEDCSSGNRVDYDTIWWYDCIDESPTNQFGDSIPDLDEYHVTVTVTGDASDAIILVNVSHPSGRVDFDLQSRRANPDP